jgi:elongation factor Tu
MTFEHTYTLKAKITLYNTGMGGRKKPVYSGYRPSFAFNTSKHYSGEIQLIGNEELKPGHSSLATIRLLPSSTLIKHLKHNDEFIITEGNHAVGDGVIEEVISDH